MYAGRISTSSRAGVDTNGVSAVRFCCPLAHVGTVVFSSLGWFVFGEDKEETSRLLTMASQKLKENEQPYAENTPYQACTEKLIEFARHIRSAEFHGSVTGIEEVLRRFMEALINRITHLEKRIEQKDLQLLCADLSVMELADYIALLKGQNQNLMSKIKEAREQGQYATQISLPETLEDEKHYAFMKDNLIHGAERCKSVTFVEEASYNFRPYPATLAPQMNHTMLCGRSKVRFVSAGRSEVRFVMPVEFYLINIVCIQPL